MKKARYIRLLALLPALVLGGSTLTTAQTPVPWKIDSLSQKRSFLAAAGAGNKVLFAGGMADGVIYSSAVYSKRVDLYNTTTGTWTVDSLSRARGGLAAVAAGNKILFGGGIIDNSSTAISNRVDIYDVTTGTWTVDSLSLPRYTLAAGAAGGKVVFAGGQGYYNYYTGTQSNRVDIYDVATGTWSIDSLRSVRSSIRAAGAGTKVVFAGGIVAGLFCDLVDIYDVATGTWTSATLSQPRSEVAAVAVGNKILFAGGWSSYSGTQSDRVDIYDVVTGVWTTASLSQGRDGLMTATAGNKVLFGGGYTGSSLSNRVDIYDATTGTWSIDSLSQGRTNFVAAAAGNKILFGGGDAHTLAPPYFNRVDIYDVTAPSPNSVGNTPDIPGACLWPNPSRGAFTLHLDAPATVRILTLTGQVAWQTQAVPAGTDASIGAGLEPGVYFVELRCGFAPPQLLRAVKV